MILLPKEKSTTTIKDYCPISLIHCIGKLISKVPANCLSLHLKDMIHHGQSVFIKGYNIHDNFRFVQASAKALHARKSPKLLLKVDMAKAFDSVAWPFLLQVMEHSGFPRAWRDWVAALLSTSMTRIAINGSTGDRIQHARGPRQGDPLSPCSCDGNGVSQCPYQAH